MNDGYIGIFDSGIGGLTVAKSVIDLMPGENIVYFGDTAHVPYGTRSREQIIEYVTADVNFLSRFDIKAVVIACNTADSIARETVEGLFPYPFFGVVDPAAKKAALATKNGVVGVIATDATVNSGAYEKAIHAENEKIKVVSKACPLLVPLVENNRFRRNDQVIETVLREYLEPLRQQNIDTLVLGCTHYPLLCDVIADIMPGVKIISSSDAAALALKDGLEKMNLSGSGKNGKREYFVSDNPEYFKSTAHTFLGDSLGGDVKHYKDV